MVLCFSEYELDVEELQLRRRGELLHADAMVMMRLLACLARRPGQLASKDEMAEEVWAGKAIADNAIRSRSPGCANCWGSGATGANTS